jgi:hypothetical protein
MTKSFTLTTHIQTLFKIAIVTMLFCIAQFAAAATLSVSPNTGVYTAGQTFTVKVNVNTSGAPINAADGTLTYNPKELTVVSLSKGAIFNLWTADPSFSNANGSITFSGGSPTGYTGAAGTVLSITFKANAAGNPKVSFSKGSVLAADGKGTNVLTTMNGGAFTISAKGETPEAETIVEYVAPANTPSAPVVESSTHTDATKWYTSKTAVLSWKVGGEITAIRTLLDSNATAVPTKVYDTPIAGITINDLDEGVQYFHIQFKNKDGWGKVAHYRLATDSLKPTLFEVALKEGSDLSNPTQTLSVKAEDATSKVRRFLMQVDGAAPYEYVDVQGSSTIQLQPLSPGYHTVVIEAFDEAGNSIINSLSFEILSFDKPRFTEYPKEINEDVIPVIKGTTRPNAKVVVSISQLGIGVSAAYAVKTQEVQSDASGEFIFIPDGRLSLGVYELTAVAIDQYGAQSGVSDPVRIAVQQPGYLKIGSMVVSFLSVLIPLVALAALLVGLIWYFYLRFRVLRKKVSKEAKEAEQMLLGEFGNIRLELLHQKAELESSRKTKKLTKAEADLFSTLESALEKSQRKLEKEIGDVEDLVD